MNLTALTRSLGSPLSFGRFAKRPPAPQTLAGVLRGIYSSNASPETATLRLLSAMKRFPIESGNVPPGDVSALNITLRQTRAPGLWDFHQQYHEARLYLADQNTGPLKSTIAEVLGEAFSKCHDAQMRWGSNMMRAHSEDDPEAIAFATMMLGDKHPTVAHVRAELSGTLTPQLLTAQETCEAVSSEEMDIWEQTEPLNVDGNLVAAELSPVPAPYVPAQSPTSTYNNPQEPSIERLLLERKGRSRPFQDFLKGMMGNPPA